MLGLGAYAAPASSSGYYRLHLAFSIVFSYAFVEACDPQYLKNSNNHSPNLVLLRCAVAVGRTFRAPEPRQGLTEPPQGYDSVSQQAWLQVPGP